MDKRAKIVLWAILVVIVGIVITEITRPRPINWNASYTSTDKIPYGCFVLYNELPSVFPTNEVVQVTENVYEKLIDLDTSETSSYMFINNFIYFDEQETNQLLDYVSAGNTVFIASSDFGGFLSDTLNIRVRSDYSVEELDTRLDFTHDTFQGESFDYSRGMLYTHFVSLDTLNSTILGHISYTKSNILDNKPDEDIRMPNFIKTDFGKGTFLLNTTPQAFTNYYMLEGNEDYVGHTYAYIPNTKVYWDEYKKAGRVVVTSPMRFVLTQIELKWAYYLAIIGLILFVLFRGKREQRIIPVIKPLENSSVEFARTVGSLYHQHKDYTDLVHKKLTYFLAYLRNRFYIDTQTINEKTIRELSAKSGKSLSETKELIEFILSLKKKTEHTEQDSITLNKKITQFKS
ncbi:DUF4350 domain-containing protein [Flagellimonas allohymeniacidonis]|uniref:DUF4350 domain-containing protein n=1 Tax=Flagellimonas allohymeniacidonis TaxID=2517819 RepID=A0A4V2HSM3_9FLAO|nr:DUF4350 domain-containing protein [Allomuricauda hymeniacidonis]TAI48270.1 DUF4350 domain-containing protein [Allomuricauda hymeniacidonis]